MSRDGPKEQASLADTAQGRIVGLETCSARPMELHPQERRRSRRIRIGQPLKVHPSDPRDEHFEELSITKNVSRDGIYFISEIASYYEGMRLFLTVPYHSPSEPMDQEYLGQVARIERLGERQWGVAIQLLTSLSKEAALFGSHGRMK